MMLRRAALLAVSAAVLAACAAPPVEQTIEDLGDQDVNLEPVPVEEDIGDAEQSYRRYLDAAPEGADTAEAMRRMADLQIEKVYGVVGTEPGSAMPTPQHAAPVTPMRPDSPVTATRQPTESDADFEHRTTRQDQELLLQNGQN